MSDTCPKCGGPLEMVELPDIVGPSTYVTNGECARKCWRVSDDFDRAADTEWTESNNVPPVVSSDRVRSPERTVIVTPNATIVDTEHATYVYPHHPAEHDNL